MTDKRETNQVHCNQVWKFKHDRRFTNITAMFYK